MPDLSETTTATFCATLVDEWVRGGVTDAVVAPGSRSTPMALALAADDRLRVHVHHDERAAAFMALGLGLATGTPAPVLTTSGTATVEMHPAVVEAHHARVPMLLLTADRPPELRDVGAPQTIDQNRLYGGAVRWFVDPGVPDATSSAMWRSIAARALAGATGAPAGPVQVNLPFRDPLVGRAGALPPARTDVRHLSLHAPHVADADMLDQVHDLVDGRPGVVLAGYVPGQGLDPAAVHALARALGWPVVAEPRSGCRIPAEATVCHVDALLRVGSWAERHRPEVVLQLGQPAASKFLGQWVAASGADVIAVDPDGWPYDADRVVTMLVDADPCELVSDLAGRISRPAPSSWLAGWIDADRGASAAIERGLADTAISEPGVARAVLGGVADDGVLVVASSMPVRDVEWYGAARTGARVLSNRGANGIDGVISTAIGVAASGVPTVALVGDVAFLHDSNALLGLVRRDLDLVIVVVDNDGGGIFSFLPQADQLGADRFEQLFGTPHGIDIGALARVHDLPVTVATSDAEVGDLVAKGGLSVVVARTDRGSNVAVHDALHAAVARELGPQQG